MNLERTRKQGKDSWDEPSYLRLELHEIKRRVEIAYSRLRSCDLCPWRCRVDRVNGKKRGVCRSFSKVRVASYNLHFGEEPPISGKRGSGTIFFSNCTLHCVFCQNYPISQIGVGKEYSDEELAGMMLYLQDKGAHNVNFVTPTHFVANILNALHFAVKKGFRLPLVYNTSGYEVVDTLKLLDGVIDIYLPDIKYSDDKMAKKYSRAKEYVKHNREALKEMYRQVGNLILNDDGVAVRGLIIRHLVLPNDISGTRESMKFIAEELSPDVTVSLMSQYFPAYKASSYRELWRRITPQEYLAAVEAMEDYGLKKGWTQDFLW